MKSNEKIKARELRKQGLKIKDIAKQLQVSKGSVSEWVRDIILTPEQINTIYASAPGSISGGQKRAEMARQKRIKYRIEGVEAAKLGEVLHAFGCALYWGEGYKHKNMCELSNSDVFLVKKYLQFIRHYFPEHGITATIHCYSGNLPIEEIENYWITNTKIPKSSFRKIILDSISRASKHKKPPNKLPYGTIHITINNSVKVVQHIFGAIEEYGNFSTNFCLG